jgi:TfoX/Sxy family transcriptional regulator of competence genes
MDAAEMASLLYFIYTSFMSDLQEFVKKQTAKLAGISIRKLYGLDAFYLSDMPFIVITSNEQIVVKVDDFEVRKTLLGMPQVSEWMLNDKLMENWFLLPDTFNKKKNKLSPILEMTSQVLLRPKKEKKKRKKKSSSQQKNNATDLKKASKIERKTSFFKRLFNIG